jgi:hypothetical protein
MSLMMGVFVFTVLCSAPIFAPTVRAEAPGPFQEVNSGMVVVARRGVLHLLAWQASPPNNRRRAREGDRKSQPRDDRARPGNPNAGPNRGRKVEKWLQELSPERRDRVLRNNRRFQQLPRERQEVLRDRLQQLREMTPNQRHQIRRRFDIFENLRPDQQRKARKIYRERWSNMEPARRWAVLGEFRRLQAMPPAERNNRLDSKEYHDRFGAPERQLLHQLMDLRN